ncbi:MAG: hypothetical protein ABEI99_01450, partial [Halobaculum sp.]
MSERSDTTPSDRRTTTDSTVQGATERSEGATGREATTTEIESAAHASFHRTSTPQSTAHDASDRRERASEQPFLIELFASGVRGFRPQAGSSSEPPQQ